jgi:DNA-binding transcriptional MerR regulator
MGGKLRGKPTSGAAADDGEGKRYYRIGEVSKITGVKAYVLRYWESEFRWMAPQKSRSKQRLYRRRDIDIILLIKKLLYEQRFTIEGARRKLRELGVGRALEEGSLLVETNDRDRFRKLRHELVAIRAML